MYEKHPNIVEPDDNIKIWRYIDFAKFISLLDTRKLFFTRADKFNDSFEGSYPNANKNARENAYKGLAKDTKKAILEDLPKIRESMRKCFLINCWHINENESAAMWEIYTNKSKGIAIQSSFSSLKKSFSRISETVSIGEINYIDYNSTIISEMNALFPYLHKRKYYIHEKELRAIMLIKTHVPEEDGFTLDIKKEVCDIGMYFDVDINMLIENIYISPTAQPWFVELVENIIKKYGYDFNVINSELNKKPVW